MFKKLLLSLLFLSSMLFSKECSPYFNPNKFYESPEYLEQLIEENIVDNALPLFGSKSFYDTLKFQKKNNSWIKSTKFKKLNDYIYPLETGIWKYKVKNNKVDSFYIAKAEYYAFSDMEIAEEINGNFDGFWNDWIEDGYEMQLVPEQTLFRYKEFYFTFSVFIYGVKKDATTLDKTVVSYWFKDYTKEVNEHIECMKKK